MDREPTVELVLDKHLSNRSQRDQKVRRMKQIPLINCVTIRPDREKNLRTGVH